MNMTTRQENDGRIRIVCSGDLDYGSADDFLRAVKQLDARHVVLDFSAVDFVDSTGVRALCRAIEAVRAEQGDITVVEIPEGIYEILGLVGCIEVFGPETFAQGVRRL